MSPGTLGGSWTVRVWACGGSANVGVLVAADLHSCCWSGPDIPPPHPHTTPRRPAWLTLGLRQHFLHQHAEKLQGDGAKRGPSLRCGVRGLQLPVGAVGAGGQRVLPITLARRVLIIRRPAGSEGARVARSSHCW